MKSYHIRHKIKEGDIVNLADADIERINRLHEISEGDLVELTTNEANFIAKAVYIDTHNVEVEVVEKKDEPFEAKSESRLSLIQSVSGDIKFNFFLEKAVELGVDEIIPIVSEYSRIDLKESRKNYPKWQKVIKEAGEQSRNRLLPYLHEPILLNVLGEKLDEKVLRICLATENVTTLELAPLFAPKPTSLIAAIGPERGWSSADIKAFEALKFKFVKLKGNILRTETAGLAIASIFQFINEKL